jgi:hypothetical protein
MDAARLAANRPANAKMAARRRALQKVKRMEAGDATVRPLTVIELRALARSAEEVAAAEQRVVEEAEARENQRRAAEFARHDRAMERAAEREAKRLAAAPPPFDPAQAQLDDIQRIADRQARRPLKPTPDAPKPAPAPPPPIRYFLSVEQNRALDAGRRLRRLLADAAEEGQ